MAKVSIGLRGWRFDEDEVFDEDGSFRPFSEMDADTSRRLARLAAVQDEPCDACWLVHGDEAIERCRQAAIVYGEPFAEVLLCAAHEPDFHYWYAEGGGERFRGTDEFQDRFHEWFAAGGRAPDWYGGVEHVDTEPESLPDPDVSADDLTVEAAEDDEVRIDLRTLGDDAGEEADGGEEDRDPADLDLDGVDIDADYPS